MSAPANVLRACLGALLPSLGMVAASAAPARGGEIATVPHSLWKSGEERICGWKIATGADGAVAIATDAGELKVFARDAGLETIASADGPVAEVPSGALARGLAVDDGRVRDRCEDLLRAQKELAHQALGVALEDDSAEARRRALELLVRLPSPKLADAIRRRLTDPDEGVRKFALRAYALLAPEDLFERTRWVLEHDDATAVEHEAIVQLGRARDVHGVDVLFDHLADCDERSLRLATFAALRRLTAHDFGRDEEAWRAWWTNHRKEIVGDEPAPAPNPAPKKRAKKLASR